MFHINVSIFTSMPPHFLLSNQRWAKKQWFSHQSLHRTKALIHTPAPVGLSRPPHTVCHFLSFPAHFHLHVFAFTLSFLSPPSWGMSKRYTAISSDADGREGQEAHCEKSWDISSSSLTPITGRHEDRKLPERAVRGDLIKTRFHPAVI